jgi:hypothetical protein
MGEGGREKKRENCIKYLSREKNFGKIKKELIVLLSKQQR